MSETIPDWRRDPEAKKRLINHMVELLREGHKMLDEVCPRCGAILFYRKDVGLRYCPNCRIFLATPEELDKVDKRKVNIKILGESPIVVDKTVGEERVDLPRRISKSLYQKKSQKFNGSISAELKTLIPKILNRILEIAEYEIERMSFIELLTALKLLIEINNLSQE